jgi:hypothetical protein
MGSNPIPGAKRHFGITAQAHVAKAQKQYSFIGNMFIL